MVALVLAVALTARLQAGPEARPAAAASTGEGPKSVEVWGPGLASGFPPGAMLYLEVASGLAAGKALRDPGTPAGRLLAGPTGDAWRRSKIYLKLGERLRGWLDAAFEGTDTASIGERLLGGRSAVALYDLERPRFLYQAEGFQASLVDELLASSKVPVAKETQEGIPLARIGEGEGAFWFRRPGRLLQLSNDPELLVQAARGPAGTRLGDEAAFVELAAALPKGELRYFLSASLLASRPVATYWIGGEPRPEGEVLAGCLRRIPTGWEEVRRRRGGLPEGRLPSQDRISAWLPSWTWQEIQGGDPGPPGWEELVASLVPVPGEETGKQALRALATGLSTLVGPLEAWARAGEVAPLEAGPLAPTGAPAKLLGAPWPPAREVFFAPRLRVVLQRPEAAPALDAGAVAELFSRYFSALLGSELPPSENLGSGVFRPSVPLYEDLAPVVRVVPGAIVLAIGPEAEVPPPPGPDRDRAGWSGDRAGEGDPVRVARLDGERQRREFSRMATAARHAALWYERQKAEFAQRQLVGGLARAFPEVAAVELETRILAGLAQDRIAFRWASP